jgi:3-hydroxyacyl-CoA dehydrogenase
MQYALLNECWRHIRDVDLNHRNPSPCFREIPGFVSNRMQYALLNECWRLIRDGVLSPKVWRSNI